MSDKVLVSALKTVAMSRGTIIVDENLQDLRHYLTNLNIRVRLPPQGMSDKEIAEDYLPNRVFVTNNSKDFLKFAVIYDIGIVATENIKSKNPEDLAEMISDAIIDYSLWSQKSGFILTLMSDGKHQFKILTD